MAIALQTGSQVWQKVKNYLSAVNNSSLGANPTSQNAFLDLRNFLAQDRRNIQLQYIAVDGVYSSSDGGNNSSQVLAAFACTLYATYLVKLGSTETIYKASNNATTAATDGTEDHTYALTVAGDFFAMYPGGRAMSSGITVTEDTTRTGSTLTLKANSASGFIIIGA